MTAQALATFEPDCEPATASAQPHIAAYGSFDAWLSAGRTLATRKRDLDWEMADWIAYGREHFPQQITLALGDMAEDPQRIRRLEKTARAFPPHMRDQTLTFDHHAHLADIPAQEALPLLKQAREEKLTPRQLRIEAMMHKVDSGLILPREDDPEDDAILALVRAWNRAPLPAREDFAELVADSGYGLIDFTPPKEAED